MKRYLNWFLATLAVATAAAALLMRSRPAPAEPAHRVAAPSGPAGETERVVRTVLARMRDHNLPLIAGSLAYYAFLAVFPAAIAAVSIYSLVLDPASLAHQIERITATLPEAAATLISDELTKLVGSAGSGVGLAAAASIVGALWSASAGTKALLTGLGIAYGTEEDRSFLVLRAIALGVTASLIVFVVAVASAVTFLPALLEHLVGGTAARRAVELGRWPGIFVMVIVGLGLLYKIVPNRPARHSPWISPGAVGAAVTWMLATVGFSLFNTHVKSFGATYGTLGGGIVLLLWLFMSGLIVLLGAEVNAVLEQRGSLARAPKRPT
jgi:membrane protein